MTAPQRPPTRTAAASNPTATTNGTAARQAAAAQPQHPAAAAKVPEQPPTQATPAPKPELPPSPLRIAVAEHARAARAARLSAAAHHTATATVVLALAGVLIAAQANTPTIVYTILAVLGLTALVTSAQFEWRQRANRGRDLASVIQFELIQYQTKAGPYAKDDPDERLIRRLAAFDRQGRKPITIDDDINTDNATGAGA